ncbi:hypothetical protein EVAR_25854_1 [Eumeta japonica]|uniref:Uncharacterized protein n=1 Tax=Eumeta variegata TaxID=151549 RepID=A0A4C1X4X1_EUMVA|nr:hypothetical protein EVAR_25854_1 [Eumeta japonica]
MYSKTKRRRAREAGGRTSKLALAGSVPAKIDKRGQIPDADSTSSSLKRKMMLFTGSLPLHYLLFNSGRENLRVGDRRPSCPMEASKLNE